MVGCSFGEWVVVAEVDRVVGDKRRWLCRCRCGTIREVYYYHLKSGASRSCGCLQRRVCSERNRTHGKAATPEYRIYHGMLKRCYNRKSSGYRSYGAQGICVSPRWLTGCGDMGGFECFLADMGQRPSEAYSLDRIDTYGNYGPDNCRWATDTEQNNNSRRCRYVNIGGNIKTITSWARHYGIPVSTVYARLGRGWSVVDALISPIRRHQCADI